MNSGLRAFLHGFGSILDIFGTSSGLEYRADEIRNQRPGDGFRKDAEALASDWRAVGGDMHRAMNRLTDAHRIAQDNANGDGLTIEDFRRISNAYGDYVRESTGRR
jgi:hypothetical protein